MNYQSIRPLLFKLDPEQAHGLTVKALQAAQAIPPIRSWLASFFAGPSHPVEAFGLHFNNPIGLAAGYDKDGLAWRGLACLGFGHIEVGTVTLRPQPGNPRPRVFRLVPENGVINRMGFPGKGAEYVVERLKAPRPAGLILGVNIGKNKDTPLEEANQDYLSLMRIFYPLADYLAINVSSPNTVGLRRLQARATLEELLGALRSERRNLINRTSRNVPILVKLAPDLNDMELEDAIGAIQSCGMDGVIVTNTTLSRDGLNSPLAAEIGGLSGAPLTSRSTAMIRRINQLTTGSLPVIGVGGVMNAQDAHEKLDAGAVLVQLYTGLIYAGPGLVKEILLTDF